MFIVDEELLWAKATTKILAASESWFVLCAHRADMDHMKAADIALSMIEKCGYNVDDLELQSLVPLPDLDQLWNRWQEHSLPNNGRISNILSLLGTFEIASHPVEHCSRFSLCRVYQSS